MLGKRDVSSEILQNEDFLAKSLVIGVSVDDIMAEVNVFDWMHFKTAPIETTITDFQKRLNFENKDRLYQKAFIHKFEKAIKNLSTLVEEVHSSYNIPSKKGTNNEHIAQYYYLKYWADKKAIAVDYNEKDLNKQKLFNLYTILFDIFADKEANFNAYNRQKEKQ